MNVDNLKLSISEQYLGLPKAQKNRFLHKLSALQRRDFVQLFAPSKVYKLGLKKLSSFKKILNYVTTDTRIARKSYYRFHPYLLLTRIIKTITNIFYRIFGGISVREAKEIIHKQKNIQSVDVSSSLAENTSKIISIRELKKLVSKMHQENEKNLEKALIENGYSLIIEGLDFSDQKRLFTGLYLSNLQFNNCTFFFNKFSTGNILKNVEFRECNLSHVSFKETELNAVSFVECHLREVVMLGSRLHGCNFSATRLVSCSFEESNIQSTFFSECELPGTHFLQISHRSNDVTFNFCSLRNTIFFGQERFFKFDQESFESKQITKPVVALLSHAESRGITVPKVFYKIDEEVSAIPIKIHSNPEFLKELNSYIFEFLNNIEDESIPPAEQLLTDLKEKKFNSYQKLLDKIKLLHTTVSGIILPGGEDIPSDFYQRDGSTNRHTDYSRSILEFALIKHSTENGVPLMALCRGFQASSIYFGAKLSNIPQCNKAIKLEPVEDADQEEYELPNHEEPSSRYGLLSSTLAQTPNVAVSHHQTVTLKDFPSQSLQAMAKYQDRVQAAELKFSGAVPMCLLQFHPEFHKAPTEYSLLRVIVELYHRANLDAENENFWKIFQEGINAYLAKKRMLAELSDRFSI